MARYIKLLSGDRFATNDVRANKAGEFALDMRGSEVDKLTLDCERWLDGATLSSATVVGSGVSLSTATPLVTVTLTGPANNSAINRVTLTASDGRIRKVDFVRDVLIDDQITPIDDYGWGH
jgi:hypothetical protein